MGGHPPPAHRQKHMDIDLHTQDPRPWFIRTPLMVSRAFGFLASQASRPPFAQSPVHPNPPPGVGGGDPFFPSPECGLDTAWELWETGKTNESTRIREDPGSTAGTRVEVQRFEIFIGQFFPAFRELVGSSALPPLAPQTHGHVGCGGGVAGGGGVHSGGPQGRPHQRRPPLQAGVRGRPPPLRQDGWFWHPWGTW